MTRLPLLHRESRRTFVAQRKRGRIDTSIGGRRLADGSMADVRTVEQLGFKLIVDLAPKLHVVHRGRAADAVWADVVELNESALATTMAVARNVSAATARRGKPAVEKRMGRRRSAMNTGAPVAHAGGTCLCKLDFA